MLYFLEKNLPTVEIVFLLGWGNCRLPRRHSGRRRADLYYL